MILLHRSTKKKMPRVLRPLESQGDAPWPKQPTQLELAARAGDAIAVRSLLEAGHKPNAGTTGPLYEAILSDCDAAALLLLSWGASPQGRPKFPALNAAASSNNLAIARHLLEQGVSPNLRGAAGAAAMHVAAASPEGGAMLRLLYEFCSHINATDDAGETPLFYAVRSGGASQVLLLRVLGVRLNAANAARKCAAEYAPSPQVEELARSPLLRR